jgi:transcriptional regulator with XRE-family HTH domain
VKRKSPPIEWWPRYEVRMKRGKFRTRMKDVAEAAGISHTQLTRWVRGKGEPTISQAAGMVMLVDASLDEIFIPDEKAKKAVLKRIEDRRR